MPDTGQLLRGNFSSYPVLVKRPLILYLRSLYNQQCNAVQCNSHFTTGAEKLNRLHTKQHHYDLQILITTVAEHITLPCLTILSIYGLALQRIYIVGFILKNLMFYSSLRHLIFPAPTTIEDLIESHYSSFRVVGE